MKPGQNPLGAPTDLEDMASQHSPTNCFHCPKSEYEVEKRTFCEGLQPDREQILLAICFQFENLQRQRKEDGGVQDAGYAFMADAGGRLGGNRYSS